ncbi:PKD domain-containing protein [Cohnella sp. WQ 127256]|uniref:PKD domain-containing protein n=1 Tax=Cohnella sp. WQ 127256 TaxID=2938790 RepID=UPI002118D662|nr:PKD domain-containing protein [Cohnella sp. WQ 127256]
MKKLLNSLLLVSILIGLIPLPSTFAYPNNDVEFKQWLIDRGIETEDKDNHLAEYSTYKRFNLIVYGKPYGEKLKESICSTIPGMMDRYLGFDVKGKPFTNECYAKDADVNKPDDWPKYVKVEGAPESWRTGARLTPSQVSFMRTAQLIGNGASSFYNVNYIAGKMGGAYDQYTKIQSPATWRAKGSVYVEHVGASGKIWYASFTTPSLSGNDGGAMVDGEINTPNGLTYTIPRGADQVDIPHSITASAKLSGYVTANDVLALTAKQDKKEATKSRVTTVTLNNLKLTKTRSEFPVSNETKSYPVLLEGEVSLENVFTEKDKKPVKKQVTVIVEPEGEEPGIRATAATTPNAVKFNKADIKVKLDATGELLKYTDASNVKEWVFYAREKSDTTNATLQTKTVAGNALNQKTNFTFTIPKSKVTGQSYTEIYAVTATAVFKKAVAGKTSLSAPAEASTYVYKDDTPPPVTRPDDPNKPPIAVIGAPYSVDVGSPFTVNGSNSYDTDGQVVLFSWDGPCFNLSEYSDNNSQIYQCNSIGTYTFGLKVVDDDGAVSQPVYRSVIVRPPLPAAIIIVDGTLKENRKVVLDGSESVSSPSFPINKYEWEITPSTGGSSATVKYVGSLSQAKLDSLFKKEGTYNVKLTVCNSYGCDTRERFITVKPDKPPIMETSSITPVYRQSYNENKALIELEDYSYSSDGDIIVSRTVAVAFDTKNDGCANDGYTTLTSVAGKRYSYFAPEVGNYCFKVMATETFGEPTIPQFITAADYRSGVSEVKVNVDNYAPSTSFGILKKKFVDINFNLGESTYASMDVLKTKVNTLVLPELAANGIDAKVTYSDSRPAASKLLYFETRRNRWDNEDKEDVFEGVRRYAFDPDKQQLREITVLTSYYSEVQSPIVMPDDTIYYVKYAYNYPESNYSVMKYDPVDKKSTVVFSPPYFDGGIYGYRGFKNLGGLAINRQGNIFVSTHWKPTGGSNYSGVMMYDPVTRTLSNIAENSQNGNGYGQFTTDFMGNVYAAIAPGAGSSRWNIFSPQGNSAGYTDIRSNMGYVHTPDGASWDLDWRDNSLSGIRGAVSNPVSSRSQTYLYYTAKRTLASESGLMKFNTITRLEEQIDPNLVIIVGMTYDEKLYYYNPADYSNPLNIYVYDPAKNSKELAFTFAQYPGNGATEKISAGVNLLVPTTDVAFAPASDIALKGATWRDPTNKYYVDISNKYRADLSTGQIQSSMLKELLEDNISYNVLGAAVNEAQSNALIALNDGNGKYYDNSDPDTALTTFRDDLITRVNQDVVLDHYLLLGESLDYMTSYLDPEYDEEISSRWRFDHDPSVFENNQGSIDNNGGFIPGAIITPPKVGKYEVQYQAQDDPTTNSNYFSYRKWSEGPGDTLTFYVHRAPFALYTASANLVSNQYHVNINEYSYDLDHQTATGKGIVQKVWRWKNAKDTGWTPGLPPSVLADNEQYVVSLKVKDIEGAWSDENVQIIGSTGNLPPVALFTAEPARLSAADNLIITDLSYDPNNDPIVERKWEAMKDGVQVYAGATAPTAAQLKSGATSQGKPVIGTYTISLQVRDAPPVGISMWSNIYKQVIQILNVPPEAEMVVPNGTKDSPTIFNSKRPNLSWKQTDVDPGTVFKKYQLQIINETNNNFILDTGELNQNTSSTTASWIVNKDLPSGKKMQVRVRVNDGTEWSKWSTSTWFMINSPPKADFDWTPKPAWEGDQITLINQSTDPDEDSLTYHWEMTGPKGYSRSSNEMNPKISDTADRPGIYNVTLTVKDPNDGRDTITKQIVVGELTLAAWVKHTPEWEQNRLHWNSKYPKKLRADNVFWAGEAFVLEANVTDTGVSETHAISVNAVAATELQKSLTEASPGSVTWTGILREGDTHITFEDLPDGIYSFVFTVNYSNGVTKTSTVIIEIRNTVDEFVQVHRIQ